MARERRRRVILGARAPARYLLDEAVGGVRSEPRPGRRAAHDQHALGVRARCDEARRHRHLHVARVGLVDAEEHVARLERAGERAVVVDPVHARAAVLVGHEVNAQLPSGRDHAHDFVIVLVACVFGALRAVFFTSRARVVAAHVALALRFFAQAPTAFRAVATFRARAAIGRVTARVIVARVVLFARVVIARVARRASVAAVALVARGGKRTVSRRSSSGD